MTPTQNFASLAQAWPKYSRVAKPMAVTVRHRQYLEYYGIDFLQAGAASEYRFGTLSVQAFTIAVQSWQPLESAKGTIFIVHGYWEHSGLCGPLIELCLQAGFAVVVFDEPGHGLSSGEPVAIDSFHRYVSVLQAVMDTQADAIGPKIGIGQSTGGAVLLGHFFTTHKNLDDTILLSPLVRAHSWRWLVAGHSVLYPWVKKFPRNMRVCGSHDPEFAKFIKSDSLQSFHVSGQWISAMRRWAIEFVTYTAKPGNMLFIQGEQDDTVDWRYNLAAVKARVPELTVAMIPGAFHNLVNESEQFREPVFSLVRDRLRAHQTAQ